MNRHPVSYTHLDVYKRQTIYTPNAILKYRIFAAYLSDDKHILLNYNLGREEDSRKAYIDEIMGQRTMKASLDTDVPVDESSSILTLSTCHSAGTVSYTHLDVYKRQALYSAQDQKV